MKLCDTKEKIRMAGTDLIGMKKLKKPCTSAAMITFSYGEWNTGATIFDRIKVQIMYPDQFKEIRMVKAVLPRDLVASVGGYVGLFLGKVFLSSVEIWSYILTMNLVDMK